MLIRDIASVISPKAARAGLLACAVLAAGLVGGSNLYAQDGATPVPPAGAGEPPAFEMPSAPDITKDFDDAKKSPEAVKAGEEALAKLAKAYREAKSISDTVTLVVDMMGRKQEQSLSVARDANGARLDLGGMMVTAVNGKVYLESSDAKGKFVAYPMEGSLLKTLESQFGGFDPPMPRWILDTAEPTGDLAAGLVGSMLPGAKVGGFDAAGGKLLINGEGGSVGVFTIDPTSGVLSGARINVTPPGAPAGFSIPLTITMKPVVADALATPIAFSEEGKKQVETPDDLAPQPIEIGAAAPDFTLQSLEGKSVSLASLKGKVVVIDFWAEWCGPCKRGLPHINDFAKWAKESGKPIEVYAINTLEPKKGDERIASVQDYWTKAGFAFGCLVDMDDAAVKSYGFTGIPATVVIGPDGNVAALHSGIDPQNPAKIVEELKAECEKALAPKAG